MHQIEDPIKNELEFFREIILYEYYYNGLRGKIKKRLKYFK